MDLRIDFAGLTLEHPLMNAAGTCKLTEQVQKLARSASAAIMVGSITVAARPGNTGNVFYNSDLFSLNSLGLPNPGKEYYRRELPEMEKISHDAGKPLIVSAAGFSPEEYGLLAEVAAEGGADAVELNLGCPNVWDGGKQKRIACFDLGLVHEILYEHVARRVGRSYIVGVKPSPFSDPVYLTEFGSAIRGFMRFVTAANTFPNALDLDEKGMPRITPAEGLAGFAGPAMKPIALGQVKQYRANLPGWIKIAGAGGIQCGQDMVDFRRAGAVAMQINTAYSASGEDEKVFERILTQYVGLADLPEPTSSPL